MCYTDGSTMIYKVGAGVYNPDTSGNGSSVEMSYRERSTVLQAETFAVEQAAKQSSKTIMMHQEQNNHNINKLRQSSRDQSGRQQNHQIKNYSNSKSP